MNENTKIKAYIYDSNGSGYNALFTGDPKEWLNKHTKTVAGVTYLNWADSEHDRGIMMNVKHIVNIIFKRQ